MSKLTSRGWITKLPKITSDEAKLFTKRLSQSHTQQWKMDVSKYIDGESVFLATDVPIVRGTLILDSSDPIRRRLEIEVGGGEKWEPSNPSSVLAPYGQHANLYTRIDYADGTWSPWLQLFSGQIQSCVFERPSLVCTIEASDRSAQLEEFLHIKKKSYSKKTLFDALVLMAKDAIADTVFGIDAPGITDTIIVKHFVAEAGQSRLEAANALAGAYGYEVFFDWNSEYIIRKDITDEDDNNWNPSAPGGDIGTVTNPVAVLRDGVGGNLIGMTTSVSREGAANAVAVNLTATRDKKHPTKELHWQHLVTATGPIAYGDSFGRIPIVISKQVGTITEAMKTAKRTAAKKILKRRKGMLKYIELDALPIPFLEPDDKVNITAAGVTESHYVQRVEFDLNGGPMRVRTRTLAVTDIMEPPPPGPTYYDKVMELGPYWYYQFENPLINDDSSPNHHDTDGWGDSTSVSGLYPTPSGSSGLARYFPGTDSFRINDSPPLPSTNPFTFVTGVKYAGVSDPPAAAILTSISASAAANTTVYCGLAADGRLWMRCYSRDETDDLEYVDLLGSALDGATHHLVYSFDAVSFEMRIYVDGSLDATENLGEVLNHIGAGRNVGGSTFGNFFVGVMDEPAWFDRCLSSTEVAALYWAWITGAGY